MPGEERWIGDYRSVGLVDWPPELRRGLVERLRRTNRKLLLWLVAPPGLLLAGCGLGLAAESLRLPGSFAILLVFAGAAVIALGGAILRGNDLLKLRGPLRQVLRCERPERFEPSPHVLEEIRASRALGRALPDWNLPTPLLIDPASSRLLQAGEAPAAELKLMQVLVTEGVGAAVDYGDLPAAVALTEAELEELGAFIRRHTRHWASLYRWYTFVSVVAGIWIYRIASGQKLAVVTWGFAIAGILLWIWMTRQVLGPHRVQRRIIGSLRRDREAGTTEAIAGATAVADLRREGQAIEGVVTPGIVRRLASGLWWEVDGTPAVWRRS